jgi:hypothetical protein
MAVTTTAKGRYIYLVSDGTGAGVIAQELAQELSDQGLKAEKVIDFDTTNKFAVAER